ncbi:hypothetical protein [Flavobacterium sp.]|uniref:hypothetical protein n=1 Tax=Flavobacterium sp. TaxID=239 RepID=UPI0031E41FD2
MKEIAIEKFENNEDNFFKMFQKAIIDDESSFDQTTTIKVYFNNEMSDSAHIYFRFEIETERTHYSTEYYRYDYNFEEGGVNNIDEDKLNSIFDDIQILSFFGNEISNQNYI